MFGNPRKSLIRRHPTVRHRGLSISRWTGLATAFLVACLSSLSAAVWAASSNLPAPAPAWTLPSTAGGSLNSTNYWGKVILLNFFDTTCFACSNEIPGIILLQKNYAASGLQVIGISVDPSLDHTNPPTNTVTAFGAFMQVNYPLVMAEPSGLSMETAYGAIAFPSYGFLAQTPTSFIINRQNQVVQTLVNGAQTYATFAAAVKPQLALSASPSIQVSASNSLMTLVWPVTPATFALETTGDLSTGGWTRFSASSVRSDGTNNSANLPPGKTNQFFRLISP